MTDAIKELEERLLQIGEYHMTFAYPSPELAMAAFDAAHKKCRWISMWRHIEESERESGRQYITALGEHESLQESQMRKAEQVLGRTGTRVDTPAEVLQSLSAKRRALMISVLSGGPSRLRANYGNQGAHIDSDGTVRLRPRQG